MQEAGDEEGEIGQEQPKVVHPAEKGQRQVPAEKSVQRHIGIDAKMQDAIQIREGLIPRKRLDQRDQGFQLREGQKYQRHQHSCTKPVRQTLPVGQKTSDLGPKRKATVGHPVDIGQMQQPPDQHQRQDLRHLAEEVIGQDTDLRQLHLQPVAEAEHGRDAKIGQHQRHQQAMALDRCRAFSADLRLG